MMRRLPSPTAFVLAALASQVIFGSPSRADGPVVVVPGDADGNGRVDMMDVSTIERALADKHFKIPRLRNADVTQNNQIDPEDNEVIAMHVRGEPTLDVRAFVRYGRNPRLQTGDTILIQAADRFRPLDMKGGTVRIRSQAAGYDSGDQRLTHEHHGRSIYYHWSTATLKPAADYQVEVKVEKTTGEKKSQLIQVSLHPVNVEDMVLATKADLSLPYWNIGLYFTRNYCYESVYDIYKGDLGYGWLHSFGVTLTEFTDGSVSFYDTNGTGRYFRPDGKGSYISAPGDFTRLYRDPDGTFQLKLPNGSIWRFRSDLKLASYQDLRGKRVHCSYDAKSRLEALTDLSGQQIRFEYKKDGKISRATDSTGRTVAYEYDENDHLVKVIDPAGQVTRYNYDSQHRLTQVTDSDGRGRYFAYDWGGRLRRTSRDGGIGALVYDYDLSDMDYGVRTITDALGRSRTIKSAGDGFPVEIQDGAGRTTKQIYDDNRRLVGYEDGSGHRWTIVPDERNNPVQVADPEGNTVRAKYAPQFRAITALTDANGIGTKFEYKESGDPTITVYADGTSEINYYTDNVEGRIVERVKRDGRRNRYEFDKRGLLTRKLLADGTIWSYRYDPRGNLLAASGPNGELTFEYDIQSRITKASYPGARAFSYGYDPMGRTMSVINPDGERLAYSYDEAGRLSQICGADGVALATYEYDRASQLVRRTLVNGVSTRYRYDQAGQLGEIVHENKAGAVLSGWSYSYDPCGNRIGKVSRDGAEKYTNDHTGQVARIEYGDGDVEEFSYDKAGNRLSHTRKEGKVTYAINVMNQYTSVGGSILSYDRNGNLSSVRDGDSVATHEYDPEGRLIRVRLPNRDIVTYSYDALGRLASRTEGVTTCYYIWDRQQIAIEEGAGHVTRMSFRWGMTLDEALSMTRDSATYYYLQDGLRSITELTDSDGVVAESTRYRAFGEPMGPSRLGNPFLFTGALFDSKTASFNMRARWYSPKLGRFLQTDPIGIRGGLNLYAYANNSPTNITDPLGTCGAPVGPPGFGGDGATWVDWSIWFIFRGWLNSPWGPPPTFISPIPGFGDGGPGTTNPPPSNQPSEA